MGILIDSFHCCDKSSLFHISAYVLSLKDNAEQCVYWPQQQSACKLKDTFVVNLHSDVYTFM
jgi:hypothetical protein